MTNKPKPHLTLRNAPRVARAFQNLDTALDALKADPVQALCDHGEDLGAIVEFLLGPVAVDMPLDETVDLLNERMPVLFAAVAEYFDGALTPKLEQFVQVVQAIIGDNTESAPPAGNGG